MIFKFEAINAEQRQHLYLLARALKDNTKNPEGCNYLLHNGLGTFCIIGQISYPPQNYINLTHTDVKKYLARTLITTTPQEILHESDSLSEE